MTPEDAVRILAELARRSQTASEYLAKASALREAAFPRQREFLDDQSPLKAALCTRRAGKSSGCGISLYEAALARPGVSCLYVALTRASAKQIMWRDVLQKFDRDYELGGDFNLSELSVTLPNGSAIYLLGADASEKEREKILGRKFARAVVDESASFRVDLEELVCGTIRPALADLHGDLTLIGTPGNVRNFFYKVTTGKVPGWSLHRWSATENPHVDWKGVIDALVRETPGIEDTPLFRQHYLGEWCTDDDALIYHFDYSKNGIDALPGDGSRWSYVAGVDLGYTDDSAVTVFAFRPGDPVLYIAYSEKRPGLIVSEVAEWLRSIQSRFPRVQMVIDTASRQVVEELRMRHRLPLEAAEKSGKSDAMAMLDSDLRVGRVRVVIPECQELIDEWSNLVWDRRALEKGRRQESPLCPNHASDSAIYSYRLASTYVQPARPDPEPPASEGDAFTDRWLRRQQANARKPFWERT